VQTAGEEFCPGYVYTFVGVATWRIVGVNAKQLFLPGRRLKFLSSVDGTIRNGAISTSDYNISSPGDTTITMDMEGSQELQNEATEVCFVTSAAAFSPIIEDPLSGAAIRDICTGQVGANEVYLIVGDNGQAAYSTNGAVSWTAITTGLTTENIISCCYVPGSQMFYFIDDSDDQAVHSWDGIAAASSSVTVPWTTQANDQLTKISWNRTEDFIAVAFRDFDGADRIDIYYTQDEFTTHINRGTGNLQSVGQESIVSAGSHPNVSNTRIWIADNQNVEYYSSLADTTTSSQGSFGAAVSAILGVEPQGLLPAPDEFVMVGLANGDLHCQPLSGADSEHFGVFSGAVRGFAYSELHQRTLAFGDNAQIAYIDDVDVEDNDQFTFVQSGFQPTANITCGTFNENDGLFVLCADNGQICRDSTGVSPGVAEVLATGFGTIEANSPFAPINDISSGQIGGTNYVIAVGNGGNAAYSTDGCTTWTSITTGVTDRLNCIDYDGNNEAFMIGGNNGVILYTTNGTTVSDPQVTSIASLAIGGTDDVEDIAYYATQDGWNALVSRADANKAKVSTADAGVT
jgi:hypothetical protein